MKLRFVAFLFLIGFVSCRDGQKEGPTSPVSAEAGKQGIVGTGELTSAEMQKKCEVYRETQYIPDSVKASYVNQLLSSNSGALPAKNRAFLMQLYKELAEGEKQAPKLAIERALFPVFKLTEDQIGVFGFPVLNRESADYEDISIEYKLVSQTGHLQGGYAKEKLGKLIHYPQLLDSVYSADKPRIYIYTTEGVKSARIKELGFSQGECSEYYHYSFETAHINKEDRHLFASQHEMELVYGNNPEVDRLIQSQLLKECEDCPSSSHLDRTFARLKGTENLYFLYADTFPLNNQLDTPLRGLVLKTNEGKIIHLWYEAIDLFGCSCL